eukprot:2337595-Rhodomonas_salina.1
MEGRYRGTLRRAAHWWRGSMYCAVSAISKSAARQIAAAEEHMLRQGPVWCRKQCTFQLTVRSRCNWKATGRQQ